MIPIIPLYSYLIKTESIKEFKSRTWPQVTISQLSGATAASITNRVTALGHRFYHIIVHILLILLPKTLYPTQHRHFLP